MYFLYGHVEQRKTEYLVLADRYVQQARELEPLVGADGMIHVAGCDDAGKLIQVLGYKFEHGCSTKDASLITADAERAFLTVDSGFPLTHLEQSLQEGTPFSYAYPATRVPILFTESDWQAILPAKQRAGATLLDMLLNYEDVDRLYAGLARVDPQTRSQLMQTVGLRRLLGYAPIFDFYGSRICIRSGAVVVPGGEAAEKDWADLVGASPRSPGDFVYHLMAKDQGWMAAYFDALSRVSPEQQAHLVANGRLKRLYAAYRSPNTNQSAGISVFPRNANLLLLFARVPWDAAGEPKVPGDAAAWKDIFAHVDRASHLRELVHFTRDDSNPDRLLEALVACTNLTAGEGPAQIYLTLTAINDARPAERQLSEGTVQLLASHFDELNNWYPIFVEFPSLDENSIKGFVGTVDHVNGISNLVLRANVLGAFQAELGIWQILARQRQIPVEQLNASWQAAIQPYGGIGSNTELFDAARKSFDAILVAAGGKADFTQGQVVDLLAGPAQSSPEGMRVHEEITRRMRAVLDDQRLVPLDTLFGLYDGLGQMAHGAAIGDSLLPLAAALREFELPRPIFTSGERVTWSPTVYVSRHAELQVRTDLTKVIKTPGTPAQLEAARARLTPFLRDTLVGLNYAYYEPPGSQVLHSNPLFVRAHDFSASSIQGIKDVWGPPSLIGIGATAGGGAYFIGSLADLPFALALTEEDFISPEKLQALIWKETVPELLVNSILPRWWTVNQDELHATALYQRAGEELLTASAKPRRSAPKGADRPFWPHRLRPNGRDGAGARRRGQHGNSNGSCTSLGLVLSRRRVPQEISGRSRTMGACGPGAGCIGAERSRGHLAAPAVHGLRCAASHSGRQLHLCAAHFRSLPGCRRLRKPALRRIVGIEQPLLGAAGRRKRLCSSDAQHFGSRVDAPDGGEHIGNQHRRLAGSAARHAANRRGIPPGKDQYSYRKLASKQPEHREWGNTCRIEDTGSSPAQ